MSELDSEFSETGSDSKPIETINGHLNSISVKNEL